MTFSELDDALERAGCGADAAQSHATLTGLICAAPQLPRDWVAQVSGGGDDETGCRTVLERLETEIRAQLGGGDMSFDLLLPDDDEPLEKRARSLANWCQGFIAGLTMGGVQTGQPLPGDVGEVVSDFSELSRAGHEGAAGEEDERAYVELCEFVRVGAQLAFEELRARR